MKLVPKLILAGVAVLIVAVLALFFAIDVIARTGVERGATYAFGVPTSVSSMDVGVFGGTATLAGVDVRNPPGFARPSFLTMSEGSVAVTLGTLLEDEVRIPSIRLNGIGMTLLRKGGGASNYETIMQEMEKLSSGGSGDTTSEKGEDSGGKKFVIDQILIEDIHVIVDEVGLDAGMTELEIDIERIEVKDVGSGKDQKRTLAEVNAIVLKAIMEAVVRKAGGVLPEQLLRELSGGLADLEGLASVSVIGDVTTMVDGQAKALEGVFDNAGTAASDVLDGAGDAVEAGEKALGDVGKSLGGLFDGKSDKDGG